MQDNQKTFSKEVVSKYVSHFGLGETELHKNMKLWSANYFHKLGYNIEFEKNHNRAKCDIIVTKNKEIIYIECETFTSLFWTKVKKLKRYTTVYLVYSFPSSFHLYKHGTTYNKMKSLLIDVLPILLKACEVKVLITPYTNDKYQGSNDHLIINCRDVFKDILIN